MIKRYFNLLLLLLIVGAPQLVMAQLLPPPVQEQMWRTRDAEAPKDTLYKEKPHLAYGSPNALKAVAKFVALQKVSIYAIVFPTADVADQLTAEQLTKAAAVTPMQVDAGPNNFVEFADLLPSTGYTAIFFAGDPNVATTRQDRVAFTTKPYDATSYAFGSLYAEKAYPIMGSQALEGFAPLTTPIDRKPYSKTLGWAMSEKEATVKVNGAVQGKFPAVIPGMTFASTADVTLAISRDGKADTTVTLVASHDSVRYFPLSAFGPITQVKFTAAAANQCKLIDFGNYALGLKMDILPVYTSDAAGKVDVKPTYLIGGVEPITYKWIKQDSTVVSNSLHLDTVITENVTYMLEAKDAAGTLTTFNVLLYKSAGKLKVASFEEDSLGKNLPPNSYWRNMANSGDTVIISGSFAFMHHSTVYPNYVLSSGIFYSNSTDTTFDAKNAYTQHDSRSCVGKGANDTKTYGTYFYSPSGSTNRITVLSHEGEVIPGVYITNTANNVDAVKNWPDRGFGAEKFLKGDFVKVIFSNGDKKQEVYLVDYRDEKDTFYLDDWAWVPLSGLGKVKYIDFAIQSFVHGMDNGTFPFYFSIDELGADTTLRTSSFSLDVMSEAATSMDLFAVFESFKRDKPVQFTIVSDLQQKAVTAATASLADNKLTVTGWNKSKEISDTVVVKGVQHGVTYWFKIPVYFSVLGKPYKLAFDITGPEFGSVTVTRENGNVLTADSVLRSNQIIIVTTKPVLEDPSNPNVKPGVLGSLSVTGAQLDGINKYVVQSDVTVTATFSELMSRQLKSVETSAGITVDFTLNGDTLKVGDHIMTSDSVKMVATVPEKYDLKKVKISIAGSEEGLKATVDEQARTLTVEIPVKGDIEVKIEVVESYVRFTTLTIMPDPTKATVTVSDLSGKAIALSDSVKLNDTIKVTVKVAKDFEILGEPVLTNLKKLSDGKYLVTGDFTISVTLKETTHGAVSSTLLADATVYPNPCGDQLRLKASATVASYSVFTVTGAKVLEAKPMASDYVLSTEGLSQGLYFIRLVDLDGGIKVLRFQKM